MGLDLAEFFLNVEDTFQVDIFESAVEKVETLDDLVTLLEQETAKSPHSATAAERVYQEGFLTVQSFLARELEMEPSQLLPETQIAPLLKPLAERRRIWKKMRKEVSGRIPSLYGKVYNTWGSGFCLLVGFFFGLFVAVITLGSGVIIGTVSSLASGTMVGLLLYGMGLYLFSSRFSTIPENCRTLGGLAKRAVATKISLDPDGRVWNRESIEKELLRIVSEQSWTPLEKISLSKKLVDLF